MLINLGKRGATSRRKSQIPEGPTPEEKSKKLIEGYRESYEQVHRKLSETARKFARTALDASCNKPCQKKTRTTPSQVSLIPDVPAKIICDYLKKIDNSEITFQESEPVKQMLNDCLLFYSAIRSYLPKDHQPSPTIEERCAPGGGLHSILRGGVNV